jgi:CRISPR-associated helicase Cas3
MDDINFLIKQSYLPSAGDLRLFQREMQEFASGALNKRIALLSAPTGAGKTFGFKKMILDGFIMIILPNNLLSNEVYDDFKKEKVDIALLNSQSLNESLQKYKDEGFEDITKDKVIESIITGKKIVITNPELFYYIILNKYKYSTKSDSLSDLIKDGLRLIVIDEVHVYSRDQINIILGILKLINPNIKIMFSTATLPNFFKDLIKFLFDERNVIEINATREYIKSNDNKILQGPLNITIPKEHDINDFIKDKISLLKTGFWFIIADSIRNIQSIYNLLIKSMDKNEIRMISAYHDPTYSSYKEMLKSQQFRIIIGSNIIEQGINPPSYFSNYIIEPGLDIKNFIQRIGRIGRNSDEMSSVYIIFKNSISNTENIKNINTITDLFSFIEKKLPEKNVSYSPKYIGTYSALISQVFSHNLRKVIHENINNDKDGWGFSSWYYKTESVVKFIQNIESDKKIYFATKKQIPEIKSIIEWWKLYYESLNTFIPTNEKIKGFDVDDKVKFSYDYIWTRKNKVILNEDNGIVIVKGFNDKTDYEFNVYVKGIPFNGMTLQFKQISPYNARTFIIEKIQEYIKNSYVEQEYRNFLESLKDIIMATADYERLNIEVID